MNKSTFETNKTQGFNTKMEMDVLINEVMIREKQTTHSNQEIKMKIPAFKKKAMGGLYWIQITCSDDTGFKSSKLILKLTQRFM